LVINITNAPAGTNRFGPRTFRRLAQGRDSLSQGLCVVHLFRSPAQNAKR
jgi:hypothetical protein